MDRLNFSLPEFTRIVWANEESRKVWEPRIARINTAWPLIERETVLRGLRPGMLQSIAPDELLTFQGWCLENKLEFVIVAQEGEAAVYGNAAQPVISGRPWKYRVYVGKNTKEFLYAWTHSDIDTIGDLLGYPKCCVNFFRKQWCIDGWRDLVYPMVNFESATVEGPYPCNILLKNTGVRAVFHLPCSFKCEETAKVGLSILACAAAAGYWQEVEWIASMLNWPARWSSLHGAAVIVTPCLKIITSSDALPELQYVDRPSDLYPAEGATGTEFPLRPVKKLIQIQHSDTWTDNGFHSRAAMNAAHDLILRALGRILLQRGKVIDLGCGNGLLLDKIVDRYTFLVPYGVEIETSKLKNNRHRIFRADIAEVPVYAADYELALISVRRFWELNNPDILIGFLAAHVKYLIVYSYSGHVDYDLSQHFNIAGSESNGPNDVVILVPKL